MAAIKVSIKSLIVVHLQLLFLIYISFLISLFIFIVMEMKKKLLVFFQFSALIPRH